MPKKGDRVWSSEKDGVWVAYSACHARGKWHSQAWRTVGSLYTLKEVNEQVGTAQKLPARVHRFAQTGAGRVVECSLQYQASADYYNNLKSESISDVHKSVAGDLCS